MHRYDPLLGEVAEAAEAESKRPYVFHGFLSSGDEVRDYTEHGDGELAEYVHETTEDEWEGRTHYGTTQTFAGRYVNSPIMRCECEKTGIEFALDTGPIGAPRMCPVCGADGDAEDVDECGDGEKAGDDEQTALTGFSGGDD